MRQFFSSIFLFVVFASTVSADPGPRLVYQWDYSQYQKIDVATPSYNSDGTVNGLYLWLNNGFCGSKDTIRQFDLVGNYLRALTFGDTVSRSVFDLVESKTPGSDSLSLLVASSYFWGQILRLCTGNFQLAPDLVSFSEAIEPFWINFGSYVGCGDENVYVSVDPTRAENERVMTSTRVTEYDDLPGIESEFLISTTSYASPSDLTERKRADAQFFAQVRAPSLAIERGNLEVLCKKGYFRCSGCGNTNYFSTQLVLLGQSHDTIASINIDSFYVERAFVVSEDSVDDIVLSGFGYPPTGNHEFGEFIGRYRLSPTGIEEEWLHRTSLQKSYVFRSEDLLIGTLGNQQIQAINLETGRLGQLFRLPFKFGWAKFVEAYGTQAHRLDMVAIDSTTVSVYELAEMTYANGDQDPSLPASISLSQNYPNPFNPTTTISYDLPKTSYVNLTILNTLGQQVRTLVSARYEAGSHSIEWDGRNDAGKPVSSGVYFYSLRADEVELPKKMLLLK